MKKKTILFTIVTALVMMAGICRGQDTDSTMQAVQLSKGDWEALVGYFTSSQNPDMTVGFTASDGMLVAKLLWNSSEIHLVPTSPLTFISKEKENGQPIQLVFFRDSSGGINRVQANKEMVLVRNRNYKAVVKKIMPHTPEMLKQFEGLYQAKFNPTLFLQMTERDNFLWIKQYWDNSELSFAPESDSGFYSPAVPHFTMDFEKDEKGNVVGMTAFKRDHWMKKETPHLTAAQLAALSGIYVSKDDPDNSVRFSAKGSQLILTQLWDKKEIVLDAKTDLYFYNQKESYPAVFLKDSKGDITSVVLLTTTTFIRKGQ